MNKFYFGSKVNALNIEYIYFFNVQTINLNAELVPLTKYQAPPL